MTCSHPTGYSRATITVPEPKRPNLAARLKGSGRKQPLLFMGHSDVVIADPKK